MKEDLLKQKIFSRRAFFVGGVKVALSSVLISKLYALQITDHKKYSALAKGNRVFAEYIIPKRGIISDRNGQTLAHNKKIFNLYLDITNITSIEADALLNKLSSYIKLPSFTKRIVQEEIEKPADARSKLPFIFVKKNLTWKEVSIVSANLHKLQNLFIDSPLARAYPAANLTAHIVGYTASPSEEEILRNRGIYRNPDYRVGVSGVEQTRQSELKGEPGMKHVEKDSRGRFIRNLNYVEGLAGKDISLTIDLKLQQAVYDSLKGKGGLKEESGSSVVMDIKTGEILSLASVPSFDNNLFVKGISKNQWEELINNPDAPFTNKAVSGEYSPGSTFKLVVALAALEYGVIKPDTLIHCDGKHHSGDRYFHCWKREGHGWLDLEQAIAQSCNVYFYEVAEKLGINKIAKTARKLGLGEVFEFGLQNIASGLMPDEAWKIANFAEEWFLGETLNVSIGQGETLVTPLQLAVQTARMVSGKQVVPSIIKTDAKPNFKKLSGISSRHIKTVMRGMDRVVNDPRFGLAYTNRIADESFNFAGKTGTVQVISVRKEKGEEIERHQNYHSLFVGYAPTIKPRYAISVVIEHGGSASAIAAPTANQIFTAVKDIMAG